MDIAGPSTPAAEKPQPSEESCQQPGIFLDDDLPYTPEEHALITFKFIASEVCFTPYSFVFSVYVA